METANYFFHEARRGGNPIARWDGWQVMGFAPWAAGMRDAVIVVMGSWAVGGGDA
jgi:hypothetical protein